MARTQPITCYIWKIKVKLNKTLLETRKPQMRERGIHKPSRSNINCVCVCWKIWRNCYILSVYWIGHSYDSYQFWEQLLIKFFFLKKKKRMKELILYSCWCEHVSLAIILKKQCNMKFPNLFLQREQYMFILLGPAIYGVPVTAHP